MMKINFWVKRGQKRAVLEFHLHVQVGVGINFSKIYVKLTLNCIGSDFQHPCSRIVTIFDFRNPWNSLRHIIYISCDKTLFLLA